MARSEDPRPFFLTVSFTDPHDPYACPKKHWDRYNQDEIDMPKTGYIPDNDLDPHSKRLRQAYLQTSDAVTDVEVRNARHAYYGQISYIDDKIGSIKKALHDTGLTENTIIIFTADHGDMLGEKGLWYKMSFFEESARVPLVISVPGDSRLKRVDTPVSLVDLLPTILDMAAAPGLEEPAADMDGKSLLPLLEGTRDWPDRPVISEFFAEGSIAPCFMVRKGWYKYIYCEVDPPQLYDLENDPAELDNIAAKPENAEIAQQLKDIVLEHHGPEALRRDVLASQKRRRLVFAASMQGKRTPWDYSPTRDSSEQYMRNHLDLNDVEGRARITSRE
jgi:choline-sulfatase